MGWPEVQIGSSDWMVMPRFPAVFLLAIVFPLQLSAQTVRTDDPKVIITTIEGPREGSAGSEPRIAVGDGTAWLLTKDELLKVNPKDNRLVSVPVEQIKRYLYGQPVMKVGGGSIWVFGNAHNVGGIHRIDPATGNCVAAIRLDKRKGETSLAYGMGALWVLNQFDGTLLRINPDTNKIAATIQVGKGFWDPVQVGDGAVWVMGLESGLVKRVDPQLNQIVDEFSIGPKQHNGVFSLKTGMYGFSVGEGSLWVVDLKTGLRDYGKYTLFRINLKTHELVATIMVEDSIGPPVFWNGSVWVSTLGSSTRGHLVTEIDPATNKVLGTLFLPRTTAGGQGASPAVVLAGDDSLWAFSEGSWAYSHLLIRRIELKHL
jgi:DNA-binding beta-propeller fold protein YncE